MYINGQPAPKIPMIGIHIIKVEIGEVVDIILNNRYVQTWKCEPVMRKCEPHSVIVIILNNRYVPGWL